jgi:prophage tail gpP-like protein
MPKPEEVCQIKVGGTIYSQWEFIEFERKIGNVTSHLRVRVMEITPPDAPRGWSNLRLKPGDGPVTVILGGRTVMTDGFVSVRQVILTATTKQIEIVVASKTASLPVSTPVDAIGQYKNATFLQIANKIAKPFGVKVSLSGSTDGADKKFERVSIHWGETAKQAIERLARFRNLHLTDDANGNLVAGRGDTSGSVADLVEGKNIEDAHAVMSVEEAQADIWGHGQNFGNDTHHADRARDVAALAKSTWQAYRPGIIVAEMPADQGDLLHRTNFEAATNLGTVVQVYITVAGWLDDAGKIWCEHVWKQVTIYSPSLFPTDGVVLSVAGVKHRQSNEEGTVSIIECCLQSALSPGSNPATPVPPDG